MKRILRFVLVVILVSCYPFGVYGKDNQELMAAAKKGDSDKIEALIKAGADVNVKDDNGSTALIYAASRGKTYSVKDLN